MMGGTSTSTGTMSNGVIPQFGSMGTNSLANPRINNRTKYNDPTLSMAYSNTTTNQATSPNSNVIPPPLYSNNSSSNLDNSTYSGYNYYGN